MLVCVHVCVYVCMCVYAYLCVCVPVPDLHSNIFNCSELQLLKWLLTILSIIIRFENPFSCLVDFW